MKSKHAITPQNSNSIIDRYQNQASMIGKSHDAVKMVRSLRKNSKLEYENQGYRLILEGLSIMEAALRYETPLDYLFVCAEQIYSTHAQTVLDQLIKHAQTTYFVTDKTFALISAKDNSNGLLAIAHRPDFNLNTLLASPHSDLIIVLDGLETPGNIGSIIRSADAVNAGGIVVTSRSARLYHPQMIRSSRGACLRLPLIEASITATADFLIAQGYTLVLADTAATQNYYEASFEQPIALIMGSERFGIHKEWYDYPHLKLKIPMLGDCDSLNVAIATTVLLYEIRLQKDRLLLR